MSFFLKHTKHLSLNRIAQCFHLVFCQPYRGDMLGEPEEVVAVPSERRRNG